MKNVNIDGLIINLDNVMGVDYSKETDTVTIYPATGDILHEWANGTLFLRSEVYPSAHAFYLWYSKTQVMATFTAEEVSTPEDEAIEIPF